MTSLAKRSRPGTGRIALLRVGHIAGKRFIFLMGALLASGGAVAVGTPAGSIIDNTATVDLLDGGTPVTVTSNVDTFPVDEILDLTLVPNDAAPVNATSPDSNVPLSFTLTNTGNGPEPFRLTFDNLPGGDDFNPQNVRIYLDDGDGVFDGGDTLYVLDSNNPLLAADAARVLFIVSDVPASLASGDEGLVRLTATAQTGSGPAGTTFTGAGESGVDAVTGATTATDDAENSYVVAQITSTLTKSQSFTGVPVSGTVVTYTLVFNLSGSGSAGNLVISDPIPALTTYVPGSLTLNSVALTDSADADEGTFTGTQVEVRPNGGALAAPSVQTITFAVTIN